GDECIPPLRERWFGYDGTQRFQKALTHSRSVGATCRADPDLTAELGHGDAGGVLLENRRQPLLAYQAAAPEDRQRQAPEQPRALRVTFHRARYSLGCFDAEDQRAQRLGRRAEPVVGDVVGLGWEFGFGGQAAEHGSRVVAYLGRA